ncbi:MAG: hypothetical protein A2297_09445 [Elusimicrobia bacterium RIFOXYB2_FULL_48_7]|nr:MAG: hypothetical protein A2297_09445 [Elusimicrobia bacterium RIFOXYB2_FULL_48_7]
MNVYNISFKTPEENIAMDEELLVRAEKHGAGEAIRFWESPVIFAVMGISGKSSNEIREKACLKDNIPVIRRSSAGGTVLQGPGCLNFSLVLSYKRDKALSDVNKSYAYILGRVIECAKKASSGPKTNRYKGFGPKAPGSALEFRPISDITCGDMKVSGNAQQRKRNFMLHHGTWLYDFDLALVSKYLKEPQKRPEYRGGRKHSEFIVNVPLNIEKFKKELVELM